MLDTPFLTELDSRAAVKGSRDPLGLQQIWTRFGRHAVSNLTTVSTSVRDFTTLLLGYYSANELADEPDASGELHTFLKLDAGCRLGRRCLVETCRGMFARTLQVVARVRILFQYPNQIPS